MSPSHNLKISNSPITSYNLFYNITNMNLQPTDIKDEGIEFLERIRGPLVSYDKRRGAIIIKGITQKNLEHLVQPEYELGNLIKMVLEINKIELPKD